MSEDQSQAQSSPADRRFKGNELIVKDVGFMQAAYVLDVSELRLVAMAILVLRQDSDRAEFDASVPVTIHANLYADLFGTSRQNAYHMLEQAAKSLENRKIHWVDTYEDKKKNRQATRYNNLDWTSQCSYVPSMGIVQLCFTPQIIPFLIHVDSTFAGYEIRNLVKLTTPYEFRLYELGVAWKKTGTATFKKETLRHRLGIMSDDQFKTASNFNKMLNKALSTINSETDLDMAITPNYERNDVAKGRKIKDYTLSVSVKEQYLIEGKATLSGRVKKTAISTAVAGPEEEAVKPVVKPTPPKPRQKPMTNGDLLAGLGKSGTALRFSGSDDSYSEPSKDGQYGIVINNNSNIFAYPNEDGSWDIPGILEHISKPLFQIVGMDENAIPEELIKGVPEYKKFGHSEVLGFQMAKSFISRKIAKSRLKRSPNAMDTDVKRKVAHKHTHLTQAQINAVVNNPQFRSLYAPQGMSDFNTIRSYLTDLLSGDLSRIPDLDDYLPFNI